jgi:Flp pilus assembly protein TadG
VEALLTINAEISAAPVVVSNASDAREHAFVRRWTASPAKPSTSGPLFEQRRRSADDEQGAALVEFAFVFLLFLVLVFGMIDFGVGINTLTKITNGSREAARQGIVGASEAEMDAMVRAMWSELDQGSLTIAITCEKPDDTLCTGDSAAGDLANAESGDSLVVTVDYVYSMITPLPRLIGMGSTMDLSSTSEMRIE